MQPRLTCSERFIPSAIAVAVCEQETEKRNCDNYFRSERHYRLLFEQHYRCSGTTAQIGAVLPPKCVLSPVFVQFCDYGPVLTVLTPVLTHTSASDFFEFGSGFECLASSRELPQRHIFIDIDDGTPDPKLFFDTPQVVRPSPPNII